jgi:phenylpyruvate tautomerase PptA (4-oxalocrotonate tautomerase family)
MTESAASALTEVTTLAETAHANPPYPADAPLIRVSVPGRPDPVTAAIARHITESGSVFLELPDGRLTVVLHLDGKTWIAQRCGGGTPG